MFDKHVWQIGHNTLRKDKENNETPVEKPCENKELAYLGTPELDVIIKRT